MESEQADIPRCLDCDEPVDADGVTLTDECCETCCDGTCPEWGCTEECSDDCMADHKGEQ